MRRFEFRLERVLDFRRKEEDAAKQIYLDARAQRLECEAILASYPGRRNDLLQEPILCLNDHKDLEARLIVLDAEQRATQITLNVLREEEENLLAAYTIKRQEVAALEKLRENALEEWTGEANLEEQKSLDEWAVQRRTA